MRILSNHSFPGNDDHELLCFSGAFHDYAYFDNQRPCYFPDILRKMPTGWEPDLVLFKSPLYFAVPYGIEDCPYPTVLLLDDWFGGVDYLPDVFSKFDYILTDKTSVAMLKSLGVANVDYWPLFPFSPSLFRLIPGEDRLFDVTFTGNFNVNLQGKRLPWLRRIAALDKKYSIRLFHRAWNDEYVTILNRSKIVFNQSIKGEMNQRAFEAPACGALLFMEEENLEVRDFFEPGRDCVLYNSGNFEDLLSYYISHDAERVAVAKNGYERVQDFSVSRLFNKLVDKIRSLGLVARQDRTGPRQYCASPDHRDFVQASLARFGRGDSTLKNIAMLVSKPGVESLVLNDCAVILMSYADDLRSTQDAVAREPIAANALALLSHAVSMTPGYLTAEFNRAQILRLNGKEQEAKPIYERLFGSREPVSYEMCMGQVYPVHYGDPLRYSWNASIAGALSDSRAKAHNRHALIRFFSAKNLAMIGNDRDNPSDDEAIRWYEAANALSPGDPHVTLSLTRLYMRKKNNSSASELSRTFLSVNPFCIDFWKEWAGYLIEAGLAADARLFVESCLLFLSRLQAATPETIREFEGIKDKICTSE